MHSIHSHYHLVRMKEMGRVYWCHSVATFGVSLAMIFVPIFLLKSGYTFKDVLVYLMLQQLMSLMLQYPVARLMEYWRPHHMLAAGVLWYAVFFALLGTLRTSDWPLALLALAWALNRSMYWTAFHYIFGLARAQENASRQIAGINSLTIIATTIAPAIGGVFATLLGIGYIYCAAIFLLISAILPMLSNVDGPARTRILLPWNEVLNMRRDAVANMFNGIVVMAETNIWPLVIYLLVSSYAGVGLLSSVIAVTSVAITLYVGRRQAVAGQRHFLGRGLATYSLTSVGRALVHSSAQVFGLNLLAGVGRSLYVTPFMNKYYSNSDGDFRLGYITVMESAFSLGNVLYIVGLLALTASFSTQTVLSIGLGAVAVVVIGVRLMR